MQVTQRLANHSWTLTKVNATTYRFVAFSLTNSAIAGNEGKLFDLTFVPDEGVVYKDTPIVIDNVKIYGMGNTVDFKGNDVIVNDDETSNMSAIRTALSGAVKSTSSNPFAIFNLSAEVGKNEEVTLVDKLMVFPIDLTSMPVTVEVSFKYGNEYGNELTLRGSINSGEWISGKRYTYPLEVGANSINFGEPAVTDWVKESISVDIDKAND